MQYFPIYWSNIGFVVLLIVLHIPCVHSYNFKTMSTKWSHYQIPAEVPILRKTTKTSTLPNERYKSWRTLSRYGHISYINLFIQSTYKRKGKELLKNIHIYQGKAMKLQLYDCYDIYTLAPCDDLIYHFFCKFGVVVV